MSKAILDRFPRLRGVTDRPTVQRGIRIARRQALVREHGRFIAGELLGSQNVYRLASHPERRVVLRHRTRDVDILDEIFRISAYEPPAVAANLLHGPLQILDLGGNIGLFAVDALTRYPGSTVVSYEPDPTNIPVLERCLALNGVGDRWQLVRAAAMASAEPVLLAAGQFADSHVDDTGVEVPAADALSVLDGFDYVKMDIEGSEWPIMADCRWPEAVRHVRVFTMEWHARDGTRDAREVAIQAAVAAGFAVEASRPGRIGQVWAWRIAH